MRKVIPVLFFWLVAGMATGAGSREPVYIRLTVQLTDHFNIQSTEERLRVTAAMLKRQSVRCPECSVSASLTYSGASAEMFAQRNKGAGLVDTVRELAGSGLAEIGYDGVDEPTPIRRPQPNFRKARTSEQRWSARIEATEWFLTEFKDLIWGDPDPERAGGLKRTIEVFGTPSSVRGATLELGGDPELVHLLRRMNVRAVLSGLTEPQTYPARNLHGYRGAAQGFGKLLSPDAQCAAELFWQDGFLRLSDAGEEPVRIVPAYLGPEPLKKVIESLDRSRKHVIQVRLGDPGLYLPPGFEKGPLANPAQYGYENPKSPVLGPSALRPQEETQAAFRAEEAAIAWLIDGFIPANPGSRFVSDSNLLTFAEAAEASTVSAETLRAAAANLIDQWQTIGNHPPDFARAGGSYFSLAEMFQMLAAGLSEYQRQGTLPARVQSLTAYGPFEVTAEQGPSGTALPRTSVIRAAVEIQTKLANTAWMPVPENRIPGWIVVNEHRYNAAQFLRMMADTYLSPQGPPLRVPTSQMWSAVALLFPKTRPPSDAGAVWTLKPAPLQVANGTRSGAVED